MTRAKVSVPSSCLFVCTVSMYGIVGSVFDGSKEPIHFLFVGGWFSGVIMSHHTANSFEFVNMTGHIGPVSVADSFNESLESVREIECS